MCKNRGPVIPAPQLEVVYEAQDITAQKYISTSQPLRNQTPRRHHRPHRRNGFTLLTAECQPPPWRRHNIKWQLRKTAHFLKVKSVTKSASLTLATKGHKRPRKSIRVIMNRNTEAALRDCRTPQAREGLGELVMLKSVCKNYPLTEIKHDMKNAVLCFHTILSKKKTKNKQKKSTLN